MRSRAAMAFRRMRDWLLFRRENSHQFFNHETESTRADREPETVKPRIRTLEEIILPTTVIPLAIPPVAVTPVTITPARVTPATITPEIITTKQTMSLEATTLEPMTESIKPQESPAATAVNVAEAIKEEPPGPGELFELFGLPPEIREDIYEHVLPAGLNFVFLSPPMFPNYRGPTGKQLKPYPCGLTYRLHDDKSSDALSKIQCASLRLGVELKNSLAYRNGLAVAIFDACIPETNPEWARGFHPDRITPRLLALVAKSRFIFAGFGSNTANTLRALDDRVRANIKNILLTTYATSMTYAGNNQWEKASGFTEPTSAFERLFASQLPALEKVAVEVHVGQSKNLAALRTMLEWYDNGKISELELVFPYTTQPWKHPTRESCYHILYKSAWPNRDASKRWIVEQVGDDELDVRGRWRFRYDHGVGRTADDNKLVEATVFRLVKEVAESEEGSR